MTTTPNGFTLDDALAFVREATAEERKHLAEVLHSYRQSDIQDAKEELRRGDLIEFHPKKRGYPSVIRGKIEAINKKTVTIAPTDGGQRWRVRADVVQKVL